MFGLFVIAAAIFSVFEFALARVPSCNRPTQSGIFSQGFNLVVENYPAGSCDFLEIASGSMSCMQSAERANYSCLQIENREFHGRSTVLTPRCFACL